MLQISLFLLLGQGGAMCIQQKRASRYRSLKTNPTVLQWSLPQTRQPLICLCLYDLPVLTFHVNGVYINVFIYFSHGYRHTIRGLLVSGFYPLGIVLYEHSWAGFCLSICFRFCWPGPVAVRAWLWNNPSGSWQVGWLSVALAHAFLCSILPLSFPTVQTRLDSGPVAAILGKPGAGLAFGWCLGTWIVEDSHHSLND